MAIDDTEFESSSDANTIPESGQSGEAPAAKDVPRLERGTSVGRYVVIDFIDAGGMGAIYQAFDPELNRPVAIKILSVRKENSQGSLEADRAKTRMLREAQALAQLTHPNVVTVYDVGEYEDSIFIAMEFVEGNDLNVWRQKHQPSRDEMLAKVIDAGRGLSAAHKAGIVHRDFKPANVIVGKDGRVRVLDFGLARATVSSAKNDAIREATDSTSTSSRSLTESNKDLLTSSLTQAGSVVGTTNYMAPEQMVGQAVDERSDQFSFCVTLYESLYGCRPFAGVSVRHLSKCIKKATLQRPRNKKIPKWLDDLILRGLSFQSADRFAAMDDLLEALQNDPAVIHQELRSKRKRLFTAIGTISLSLLIAGFGIWYATSKASRLCKGAEDKLLGVWDPAVKEKVKKAFLGTKIYYAANSFDRVAKILDDRVSKWTVLRTDACMATHDRGEQSEQMLDLRMRCLNRKLSEMNALVNLFATKTDAKVLEKAVQATFDLSPLDQCANEEFLTAEMPPPEDAGQEAKVEALRKELDTVMALEKSGKYQEGMELALQSLEIARTIDYPPVEVEALYLVGSLQESIGKYEQAVKTLVQCRILADKTKHDKIRAKANNQLIFVIGYDLIHLDQVDPVIERAEAVLGRLGDQGEIKARWHHNTGLVFHNKGKYDRALAHLEQALKIREKVLGAEHPGVANSHNSIGIVFDQKGDYNRALAHLEKAQKIREIALGPAHPDVAISHNNIGIVFYEKGEYQRALLHHQQAMQIWEKALGPEHPDVAVSYNNMGMVLGHMGEYDRALQHNEKALEIWEKALGSEHSDLAMPHNNNGLVYYDQGEYDRSLLHYEQALKIQEKTLGPKHPDVAYPLSGIGWIKTKRKKYQEAKNIFERVLVTCGADKCQGEEKGPLAHAQFGLAQVLLKTGGSPKRAITLAQQAQEFFQTDKSVHGQKLLKEADAWLKKNRVQ